MDDKTKLYVFERKEVSLIFIFMLLIAVLSFIFGVKVGKSYSFSNSEYTEGDKAKVEMLSEQEETVQEISNQQQSSRKSEEELQETLEQTLEKRLQEQIAREEQGAQEESQESQVENDIDDPFTEGLSKEDQSQEVGQNTFNKNDEYSGKYTIQLGSYRRLSEAEEFANGFKIKGYNPIINQVELSDRGTWYRVSLGVFDSLSDAKDYVMEEKELFMGQDYVFGQFD